MKTNILLYGANGYTARLILDHARQIGVPLILAGRNADRVRSVAREYGCESRIFDLTDVEAAAGHLGDIAVVLNVAGPFVRTAEPMARACLETGTHYLDITGEIPVFEALAALDGRAREAGVMLMPGVGFDVVPTDCLAAHLKRQLPDATHLTLAFRGLNRISRGTARTAVELGHEPGWVRVAGALQRVPLAYKTRTVDLGNGPLEAMTIPWGDVATAWYTTGVPHIETYLILPGAAIRWIRRCAPLQGLLRYATVRGALQALIGRMLTGPDARARAGEAAVCWGEARSDAGRSARARLNVPNAYTLTAWTALEIARRVLAGEHRPGYATPAGVFGADFILTFDGVERVDLP
ncbi:MAG TPA: saccharopine dehydrogenase NADP-binding domain-containing protein [Candidatus Macondimonas sp.]|nr:saccharopine dehydrogenase NADP-binding domain-containing protein [Candidatus Macondimonas sp.]